VLLCVALLPAVSAGAQTAPPASEPPAPSGITVRPAPGSKSVSKSGSHFELGVVTPGTPWRGAVFLRNLGDTTETSDLYGADAIPARGGGFGFTPRGEKPTDVGAWITLDKSRITLKARETATVGFSVAVPTSAPGGERVGGVIAEPVEAVSGGGFSVGTRIAVAVYLTVPGSAGAPLRPSLTITKLRIPVRNGQACPSLSYTNDGTAVLDPTARITVDPVLGGSAKSYPAGKVGGLPPGGSIDVELPCVRSVPPGPSRITIELDYPGGTASDDVRVTHWPFAVIAAGILLLLVLLALLAMLLRSLLKRRERSTPPSLPSR